MKKVYSILIAFSLFFSNALGLDLTKEITIRPLTNADKDLIINQFVESFMDVYRDKVFVITSNQKPLIVTYADTTIKELWLLETAKEEFKEYVTSNKEGYRGIGVLQNGRLIGGLFYRFVDEETIYLAQYFITPKCQKQGIGFYVLDRLLPKLHPSYKKYEVLARQQNNAAILLYKKLGFSVGDISLVQKYDYDPLMYMALYKVLK